MARSHHPAADSPVLDQLSDTPQTSLLDLLDRVLSKGVMANGDLTLGVAGVDLIYVRLSALICAADRALPARPHRTTKKRAEARPSRRRR
jgi:hypothetical protein